jgi:nitrogen fixation NifU-like protein
VAAGVWVEMDKFDLFIENLQGQIFEDTKKAYGEAGFQRWRNPIYQGRMKNPDAHGKITGQCGDTMEIFLTFENNCVMDASFVTDGCGSSSVCSSFAVEMALGKTPDELTDITGEAILDKIGTFPEEEEHCAYLAAETLQKSLQIYMCKQTAPTKVVSEGT